MLQTGVSFARGSYWIEPIRPSVHLTGCDLEYLDDERVVGSYRPSLFVGILLAGEHTGFVDGHSIATTRVGVPTLLGVSDQVDIRSAQRPRPDLPDERLPCRGRVPPRARGRG